MAEGEYREDDDVPWATPENQDKYEQALGPFIVAYNRLDYLLADIL